MGRGSLKVPVIMSIPRYTHSLPILTHKLMAMISAISNKIHGNFHKDMCVCL